MWDIVCVHVSVHYLLVCACVCVWVIVHHWEKYVIKTAAISLTRIYELFYFIHNAVLQLMEQWVSANDP